MSQQKKIELLLSVFHACKRQCPPSKKCHIFLGGHPVLGTYMYKTNPTTNGGMQKCRLSRNTHTSHARFFCTFGARFGMLSRRLPTKISASELGRKLIKSALLVGQRANWALPPSSPFFHPPSFHDLAEVARAKQSHTQ